MGGRWQRRGAAAVLAAMPMLWLVACPDRELTIHISEVGVGFIVNSCQGSEPPPACCSDDPPCDAKSCDRCVLDAAVDVDQQDTLAVQFHVLERHSDGTRSLQASSDCMKLGLTCLTEGTSSEERARCLQLELGKLVEDHLSDGLPMGDLELEDANLILTLHNAPDGDEPTQCSASHLFVCAGLDETGDDIYDVVCSQCANGVPLPSTGVDISTYPCFSPCFIQDCHALLE